MTDQIRDPLDQAAPRPTNHPGIPPLGYDGVARGVETERTWPWLTVILIIAAGVRLWGLTTQSLTMDEVAELQIAHGSIGEIFHTADNFPPLSQVILHAWLKLLPSPLAARWLALVYGILAVAIVWRLGVRIAGRRVGLAIALTVAISPFTVWYSQEGRAYELYFLLAAAALYRLIVALDTDTLQDWGAYVVVALLGLWTHYYFGFVLATAIVVVLLERHRWPEWRRPCIAHLGLLAAALPLATVLPADLSPLRHSDIRIIPRLGAAGYVFFSYVAGHSLGPSFRELHTLSGGQAVTKALPWIVALAAACGVLAFEGARLLGRRSAVRMACMALGPALLGIAASNALAVTFQVRHVMPGAIPVLVLIGAGMGQVRRSVLVRAAMLVIAVTWGRSLLNRRFDGRYANEDIAGVRAFLRAVPNDTAVVLVTPRYMKEAVNLYIGGDHRVIPLPGASEYTDDPAATFRMLRRLTASGTCYWIVYTRAFHADPDGRLLRGLRDSGLTVQKAEYPGILLFADNARGLGGPSTCASRSGGVPVGAEIRAHDTTHSQTVAAH